MAKDSLVKRVTVLERQAGTGQQPVKLIHYGRADFKEKLQEIQQAEEEGFFVIAIVGVGPGDPEENSEWGEHLRRREE